MKNKNIKMLKVFLEVLKGNDEYIDLVIPKDYAKSIYDIDFEKLYQKGYKNIIFDVDNTLLPVNDMNIPPSLVNLIAELKNLNFNICILSNNDLKRVAPIASNLGVLYLAKANKPAKEAFDNALKLLESTKENTVMIGDQMLSDINGSNSYGLYSILVDPLANKYDLKTGTSHVLQNIMIKKLNKKNKFNFDS